MRPLGFLDGGTEFLPCRHIAFDTLQTVAVSRTKSRAVDCGSGNPLFSCAGMRGVKKERAFALGSLRASSRHTNAKHDRERPAALLCTFWLPVKSCIPHCM
jgi:hypothetical protein